MGKKERMLLLVVSALVAWRGEVMDWIPRLNNCIIHDPTETVSCGCIFTFVQLLFFYVTHVFLDLFFDPTATQVHLCFLFVGHCDLLMYSIMFNQRYIGSTNFFKKSSTKIQAISGCAPEFEGAGPQNIGPVINRPSIHSFSVNTTTLRIAISRKAQKQRYTQTDIEHSGFSTHINGERVQRIKIQHHQIEKHQLSPHSNSAGTHTTTIHHLSPRGTTKSSNNHESSTSQWVQR